MDGIDKASALASYIVGLNEKHLSSPEDVKLGTTITVLGAGSAELSVRRVNGIPGFLARIILEEASNANIYGIKSTGEVYAYYNA